MTILSQQRYHAAKSYNLHWRLISPGNENNYGQFQSVFSPISFLHWLLLLLFTVVDDQWPFTKQRKQMETDRIGAFGARNEGAAGANCACGAILVQTICLLRLSTDHTCCIHSYINMFEVDN